VNGKILEKYGKDSLKEELLPQIASGKKFIGIASTEPSGGSDIAGIRTTATKVEGGFKLNGEKIFISDIREAKELGGGFLTLAKTSLERSSKALSMFYLPIDAKGVETTLYNTIGRKGISTGALTLNDVFIPDDYLLWEIGRGFHQAFEGFNYARVIIAGAAIGAAHYMLDYTIEYVKSRVLFEKPLAKFEGVQFPIVEHWAKLEAFWTLTLKAAWALDMLNKGEISISEVNKYVASVKLYAVHEAYETAKECLLLLGTLGYTDETPADMTVRGILSYMAGAEGTPNIMKIILTRELIGKEYLAYR